MKKLFIMAAGALVALAGCSKEGDTPQKPVFGNETTATLVLRTGTVTRADGDPKPGTEDESAVNSLEIYIFGADGKTPDPKVGTNGNGYISIKDVDFKGKVGTDGVFSTKIAMSAGNPKIFVVANAELGAPAAGQSLYDIMNKLAGTNYWGPGANGTGGPSTRAVPAKGFVISGVKLDAEVVEDSSNNKIEVSIYRDVARIEAPTGDGAVVKFEGSDVQADFDKVFQPELTADDPGYVKIADVEWDEIDFDMTGYAVVSGLTKSTAGFVGNAQYVNDPVIALPYEETMRYVNEWNLWEAGTWIGLDWDDDLVGTRKGEDYRGPRIQSNAAKMKEDGATIDDLKEWGPVYSGIQGDDYIISITGDDDKANPIVYVYESKPGVMRETADSYEGFNADQVIALIVEGKLTYNGETKTRYWRINIRPEEAYHIIRNASYETAVNKIVTPGWSTPWEAEEEKPIIDKPTITGGEFIISVQPWSIKFVGNQQI